MIAFASVDTSELISRESDCNLVGLSDITRRQEKRCGLISKKGIFNDLENCLAENDTMVGSDCGTDPA